jgi:hypothetical protein
VACIKRQKYIAVSHQNNKAAARAHKGADNIADCNILDVTLIWLKALKRSDYKEEGDTLLPEEMIYKKAKRNSESRFHNSRTDARKMAFQIVH